MTIPYNTYFPVEQQPPIDFTLQGEGTISILIAHTPQADAWVDEHIPEDATRWGLSGVVIEHRYVENIVQGIADDGLSIADEE
jgi:hypothetical protein